jgi:multicomponent K+:H+ antiporter subunit D
MARLAGASILVSSGTLLAAIGVGQVEVTGGALFYLTGSVLAVSAFFLLIELVERSREVGADVLAVTREAFGEAEETTGDGEIGTPIPATMAILGISFLACALLLAGLPPLPGFLAKFAMLAPLLNSSGAMPATSWAMFAALILSGLATVVAMTRAGIDVFWASPGSEVPRVQVTEIVPIGLLLGLCVVMTVEAGTVMRFMEATAQSLHGSQEYIRSVVPLSRAAGGGTP